MKYFEEYATLFCLGIAMVLFVGCSSDDGEEVEPDDTEADTEYLGTGSVSQGVAATSVSNLIDCSGGRVAGIGAITSIDGTSWVVPAEVNYTDGSFPFASDLHNPCNGNNYANIEQALAVLDGSDIIEVDADGEVVTAYIFADNYFELYINGVPVGKDNVPFTQFNSDLVRFKVNRPFTIAMKLVDWEENLGLGSEDNRGFAYHPGDGGMVSVFVDASDEVIAITDNSWKAQTFYTAPIKNLSCLSESGSLRQSDTCDSDGTDDGASLYAVHWAVPSDWMTSEFDDSEWPSATTYSNEDIGVDNKSAYTNFTDTFDNPANDAQFIWSTNVVLDNEVLVRTTVN